MYSENLRLITVSENNEYLYTENGILYDKKTNAILKCPPKLDIKKVEINVKPAESAFDCNIYIEEAIINCELSRSLFFRCSNLKKVELNDSIKEIPDFAFTTCVSLKEINLNNITEVGYNSFWRCESLNYVDLSNCEVVGVGAFEKCDLYEVVFTDKIQEIKNDAFANNKNLSKCNYYNATIDDYSFYDTPLYNTKEDNKEKFMNFFRRLFFFLI